MYKLCSIRIVSMVITPPKLNDVIAPEHHIHFGEYMELLAAFPIHFIGGISFSHRSFAGEGSFQLQLK